MNAAPDPDDPAPLEIVPVRGMPEVRPGDDLAELISARLDGPLGAYDVVVVTSKAVSKAAGLVTTTDREALVDDSTERVVARRGATRIVRTKHGLTMAAAGVDASNTDQGTAVTLPTDPDADAAVLRTALTRRYPRTTGRLGVVVTDTAGRAWRIGQADMAIGCAGLWPLRSYAGVRDPHGNELQVTAPAIADEIAAAADLVTGKVARLPVAVVRGLSPAYFCDDAGPGAAALIRDEQGDLFGLGANEAVRQAVGAGTARPRGFVALDDDVIAVALGATDDTVLRVAVDGGRVVITPADGASREATLVAFGALRERLRILDRAYGTDHAAGASLDG
ncbi:coenzyme F420-0:L-glutamate ligase [Solicola gregarius]|uniref:Coenzyme F420-0:L-glutamate ligase n=1 Tax=Solicola gregarius TaxID=2908642 RepID=A0AA46YJ37_9ACTN|nr:coenzyme F420-0:L-glutamate ligase [Solicola gregarius]UYM04035.1 coenzyme F420-0:L-glutamate ligase [Solicola gregarius]